MDKSPSSPRSALDTSFPSLLVMGVCLLAAIAGIVVCGWKIVLLEQEQQDIAQERLLLERDRDAFLTYGGELPRMRDERRGLEQKLAQLTEARAGLRKEIASLEEERNKLRLEDGALAGTIATMNGQADAMRTLLGKGNAELAKLQPELENSRKEAARLKAQETTLRESIAAKQKQETGLLASIAGLERSRSHTQELLTRMSEDKEFYAGMRKNFETTLARFEETLKKSGILTEEYGQKLEDMGKFKTTLDQGMAVLSADLQEAATNLEAVKQARASHAALLKQETEQGKLLESHTNTIAANSKRLEQALEAVQMLDKKLQTALTVEANTITKLAQGDAQTRAQLAAAAETLNRSAENFKADQAKIQAAVTDLANLLAERKVESRTLGELAADLAVQADKNRQTTLDGIQAGANFAEAAQTLRKQAEKIQEEMDKRAEQARQLREILDTELKRQAEAAKLAKEVKEQIAESKRQSAELQILLDGLKNLGSRDNKRDDDSGERP